jgi:ElaB/YqjD/DUF883 family membrane-anchored ribosome-binding protein
MSSYPISEQSSRPTTSFGTAPSGPPTAGISDRIGAEQTRPDGFGETVSQLSRDIASLKDSFALLASQAGSEAAKTMRNMSQTVASQVGDAASGAAGTGADLAAAAKEHAKTFASELEGMARRNPLGTIAGTLLVGIVLGMMSRGRR